MVLLFNTRFLIFVAFFPACVPFGCVQKLTSSTSRLWMSWVEGAVVRQFIIESAPKALTVIKNFKELVATIITLCVFVLIYCRVFLLNLLYLFDA